LKGHSSLQVLFKRDNPYEHTKHFELSASSHAAHPRKQPLHSLLPRFSVVFTGHAVKQDFPYKNYLPLVLSQLRQASILPKWQSAQGDLHLVQTLEIAVYPFSHTLKH
jgi:hypothetical protein